MNELLAEFVRYNAWANLHLLEYCRQLTPEQFNATGSRTYGSIRATFNHYLGAEGFYALLFTGKQIEWKDNPDIDVMRAYVTEVGDVLLDVASHMTSTDEVHQEWQGGTTTYKAIALVIQLVNHGVEHRAHINTTLSQLGLTPPEVDGWNYMWNNTDRLLISS